MIVLSGAELVLPDGVHRNGAVVIESGRIVHVRTDARDVEGAFPHVERHDWRDHVIVPGFVDVHVHGAEGIDVLDEATPVADLARRLPKFGVTAFCPTSVACGPACLRRLLDEVAALAGEPAKRSARVLPAHLESNFINPEFRGAQPQSCLRKPPTEAERRARPGGGTDGFFAAEILSEIERAGPSVGIITVAPELPGALDLIRHFAARGHRVSLGHSGATFDEAREGIAAGARHATHLFNRMAPMGHRDPGLVGAVLTSREVAAEVICDGVHVHPAMVRMAVNAKGADRMMAITDGVAIAGLPDGSAASLGGRRIRVRQGAAYLDDGTLAGSATTMDRVFRFLVRDVGLSLGEAVQLTATTAAAQLGLPDMGVIRNGGIADLVVLDRDLNVAATYLRGETVRIS